MHRRQFHRRDNFYYVKIRTGQKESEQTTRRLPLPAKLHVRTYKPKQSPVLASGALLKQIRKFRVVSEFDELGNRVKVSCLANAKLIRNAPIRGRRWTRSEL